MGGVVFGAGFSTPSARGGSGLVFFPALLVGGFDFGQTLPGLVVAFFQFPLLCVVPGFPSVMEAFAFRDSGVHELLFQAGFAARVFFGCLLYRCNVTISQLPV